jgi:hypothetical protein
LAPIPAAANCFKYKVSEGISTVAKNQSTQCKTSDALFISYRLGFLGFVGSSKLLVPLVLSFRRYTLEPAVTYIMLKLLPPKQRLDDCPAGMGKMAFTLPS